MNYVLHNSHDGSLNARPAFIAHLLFRLPSFVLTLDFIPGAADNTDSDLGEHALKVLVVEETICRLDIPAHRLFPENSRLRCHSERLEISYQIVVRDSCACLYLFVAK